MRNFSDAERTGDCHSYVLDEHAMAVIREQERKERTNRMLGFVMPGEMLELRSQGIIDKLAMQARAGEAPILDESFRLRKVARKVGAESFVNDLKIEFLTTGRGESAEDITQMWHAYYFDDEQLQQVFGEEGAATLLAVTEGLQAQLDMALDANNQQ